MQAQWVFSSTFLPYTGEPIDFTLEDRTEPMHGTFANGTFHSRWADYSTSRVRSWRSSNADPSVAQINIPTAATGAFVTAIKRLSRFVFRRRNAGSNAVSIESACRRFNAVNVPAGSVRPTTVTRRIDSNQISS